MASKITDRIAAYMEAFPKEEGISLYHCEFVKEGPDRYLRVYIDVDEELNVKVLMTMTAPDCPEAEYMFREAKDMISYIEGVKSVDVELTFDPPWSFDNMSDETKAELGFL